MEEGTPRQMMDSFRSSIPERPGLGSSRPDVGGRMKGSAHAYSISIPDRECRRSNLVFIADR